jgi:hypothetical protein
MSGRARYRCGAERMKNVIKKNVSNYENGAKKLNMEGIHWQY